MTETEPEQPPNPDTNPQPENPPEQPEPEFPPVAEEPPAACPPYPNDPSITCELPPGHNVRMIHRRSLGPDMPYYEWE